MVELSNLTMARETATGNHSLSPRRKIALARVLFVGLRRNGIATRRAEMMMNAE